MAEILIADDEKNIREGLKRALKPYGHKIMLAADGKEALFLVETNPIELIIADIQMPRLSGFEMYKSLLKQKRELPVIFITGHGNVELAVEAMRMGAYDFLTKPLSLEKLELIIARALKVQTIEASNRALTIKVESFELERTLIGKSQAMQRLRETLKLLAPARGSVHIYGESGTGKELVCDALHRLADANMPLVKVNCAALSESVLESELFGHEKGAFTGADFLKIGRFEAAAGGMIFLDEVSELSHNIQVKLLRVLQEKQIERVGSTKPLTVKLRVISASNKPLLEEVAKKRFREDLYYRLNVLDVTVPPLRERRGDISRLAAHFFRKHLNEYASSAVKVTPQVYSVLEQYHWPGNVRELMNVTEKMVVMNQQHTLTVKDIPQQLRQQRTQVQQLKVPLGTMKLAEIERLVINETLSLCGGNKSKAAELLGIGRKKLHTKLSEL